MDSFRQRLLLGYTDREEMSSLYILGPMDKERKELVFMCIMQLFWQKIKILLLQPREAVFKIQIQSTLDNVTLVNVKDLENGKIVQISKLLFKN